MSVNAEGECLENVYEYPDDPTGEIEPETPPDNIPSHESPKILITELLPNPAGADAGKEFVELYNPYEFEVSLDGWYLLLGVNQVDRLDLGELIIQPYSYIVLYNNVHSYTLTNTEGLATLYNSGGLLVSSSEQYLTAADDTSWALSTDSWQYATPSPGTAFVPPISYVSVDSEGKVNALAPCLEGQYRNPETNRCRKIETDQESALVPCNANQERNPETNRCRTITAASNTLAACKDGQERNSETNRCRTIVSSKPGDANYGVLGATKTNSSVGYAMWVVGVVIALGCTYIVWEWRLEIRKRLVKIPGVAWAGTAIIRRIRRIKLGLGAMMKKKL